MSTGHVKRIVLIPLTVLGLFLAGLLVLVVLVERQAHEHEDRPAQAIVVFGAAEYAGRPSPVLRGRLQHALDLYHRGLAPLLIVTGGSGGEWRYTEAGVGREWLIAHGVPDAAVVAETQGYSTQDSVVRVTAWLRAHHLQTILVVSDGYHIYRIKKLFQRQGMIVYGSPRLPAPGDHFLEDSWMVLRQAIGFALGKLGFQV